MFELIGYQTEYTPNSYTGKTDEYSEERIVATFDNKELAQEYINKNRLKNPIRNNWDDGHIFKKKSLLGWAAGAYIIEKVTQYIPHNPHC